MRLREDLSPTHYLTTTRRWGKSASHPDRATYCGVGVSSSSLIRSVVPSFTYLERSSRLRLPPNGRDLGRVEERT